MFSIMEKGGFVYIVTNKVNTSLYIGVTSNLPKRIYEHKHKLIEGFTSKYNICNLVYYERFDEVEFAIKREKQLKNWHRDWKNNLISEFNPNWDDLYEIICN